jgi:hypothetical protein
MSCQMIRVISSPSISTTGFFTLIFAIVDGPLRGRNWGRNAGRNAGARPYGAARVFLQGQTMRSILRCAAVPSLRTQGPQRS